MMVDLNSLIQVLINLQFLNQIMVKPHQCSKILTKDPNLNILHLHSSIKILFNKLQDMAIHHLNIQVTNNLVDSILLLMVIQIFNNDILNLKKII